jgi:glutaredoxin
MMTSKQHCSAYGFLLFVLLGVGIFILLLKVTNILVGLVWLVLWPTFLWVSLRFFPTIARFLGYGLADDVPPAAPRPAPTSVRLYTNLACPFCPLVKSRLRALQAHMGFELEIVDVSLRPDVLIAKGIMSVPVVEVGQDRLVGNATSQQLAQLIEQNALAHAV